MPNLYRYTSNGFTIWTAGKRLLPHDLIEEADLNSTWLVSPNLADGNYRFYLTEKGNAMYEKTLLNTHKKYLKNIKCETVLREHIEKAGTVAYEDEYQVIILKREPQIIKDIDFDFGWVPEKVWDLNLPVEEMNIKDLEWHLDIPFWNSLEGYYDVTPNDVLKDKDSHEAEYERVLAADVAHPLDVMFYKGRWLLLDGLHRLLKLKMQGKAMVRVRKVGQELIPLIKR
jgi:hypothetical protein